MPELPEVETIKRDLLESVLNKEIVNATIYLDRIFLNKDNYQIAGVIKNIIRTGKYLVFDIDDKFSIIIHLRMTGKLIYSSEISDFDLKHIRAIFYFKDNDCLIFHDVRTFGKIEIIPFNTSLRSIKNIGIDALDPDFNLQKITDICSKRKTPVKNLLLDQTLIAGIGNIYAQEILFASKISPCRPADSLSKKELQKILSNTFEILNLAIKYNGTSISDFRRVDDKTGEFQNFLKVYGKKICPVCNTEISKIKQGGRSTNFCHICQK